MATQLIKHLKNCAENDAIYSPLEHQWGFDEQLIAKALQNISAYFPHYSRHDESHSRQILVHIERLLGDNLTKLTATDTWLLLEAAYLHDIGMVVTDEQLNKNFEEIKKHAESMKYSANEDLLSVINALSTSKTNTASAIFASVNLKAFQTLKILREIIADYYRKKHPEQTGKIITHPLLEIGLDSPRNELLPARFFGLLSKICEYHGASFEKVMELPQRQVGMGTEDCHPRFVACLLRLGDLLDLDDNRFCPVMMKMAGDLPDLSKAHHQKHLAIRHFRADPDRIEIEAECPDYESYIQTTTWFAWLREEVKNQMSRWFDIVPARHFGLLPSVGDLKAHLKEWQVFSENQRPHFDLDREKVIELLQGAGLYEKKEQAMRELLQNSVDATFIRVWKEYNETRKQNSTPCIKESDEPRSKIVHEIFKQFSIKVKIEKDHSEEEFNYWRITIIDKGTGISRQDLSCMTKIGGSINNIAKRQIVEKMPIWMRPSGIFGIGLQSAFLLTDEVVINTRSIDTGETLEIKLTNPTGKEKGNVYFRKCEAWNFDDYGSQLSFIFKSDKNTGSARWTDGYSNQALKNYDELIGIEQDFNILNICEGIKDFFNISFLNGNLKLSEYSINEDFISPLTEQVENIYYSVNDKLELIELSFKEISQFEYFYRGQILDENLSLEFNFFGAFVNLLDEKADKIITINRNKFRKNCEQVLFERIGSAVQCFFKTPKGKAYYNRLDSSEKAIVAAEYELQNWESPDYFNINWNQFLLRIKVDNDIVWLEVNKLKDYESILLYSDMYPRFEDKFRSDIIENRLSNLSKNVQNSIKINKNEIRIIFPLINKILKENEFIPEYFIYEEEKLQVLRLSRNGNFYISKENIAWYCKKVLLIGDRYFFWKKREIIPCLPNYDILALKTPRYRKNSAFELDGISPRMLFPLAKINKKITVGDLDKLAEYVHENVLNESITKEKIKEKYQSYICFLDHLMQTEEEWVKLRGNEFNPNVIYDNKN